MKPPSMSKILQDPPETSVEKRQRKRKGLLDEGKPREYEEPAHTQTESSENSPKRYGCSKNPRDRDDGDVDNDEPRQGLTIRRRLGLDGEPMGDRNITMQKLTKRVKEEVAMARKHGKSSLSDEKKPM
ncbi:hypothetical protein LWI29_007585 [Acer saccharum]|uniref:Uncharacterized protein n=1 Tax=Acer saccharum TaxID=4024 RepID=A0AA39RD19_ACESA|nr:hypothetical protein LWI29_007585 [Acer saccharum]